MSLWFCICCGTQKRRVHMQVVATALPQCMSHFFLHASLYKAGVEAGVSMLYSRSVPNVVKEKDCAINFEACWPHGCIQPSWFPENLSVQLGFLFTVLFWQQPLDILSHSNVCHTVFTLFCFLNKMATFTPSLLFYSPKGLKLLSLQIHNYPTLLGLCSDSDY